MNLYRVFAIALILLALTTTVQAQDIKMGVNKVAKGYEYQNTPFPDGIMVFKLDKSKHILKPEGVTLIQIWTMRDGSRPELWNKVRDIENTYRDRGLTTYSINFENGSSFKRQMNELKDFFKHVTEPEHSYFDPMGYATDLLKVPGFPVYYLVDGKGNIVFKTLGEDQEGVGILEAEIATLLDKQDKG